MPPEIVIDASNSILGRLASVVAKMLLMGYKVTIINAEKAVVSGEPKKVIESYKLLFRVKTLRNPYRTGIRRPRTPERLIKYAVRGMLPKNSPRGKKALKNLRVYVGVPEEVKGKEVKVIREASADRLKGKYITLGELAKQLGWKGVVYKH